MKAETVHGVASDDDPVHRMFRAIECIYEDDERLLGQSFTIDNSPGLELVVYRNGDEKPCGLLVPDGAGFRIIPVRKRPTTFKPGQRWQYGRTYRLIRLREEGGAWGLVDERSWRVCARSLDPSRLFRCEGFDDDPTNHGWTLLDEPEEAAETSDEASDGDEQQEAAP